jgi:hypothetical protein
MSMTAAAAVAGAGLESKVIISVNRFQVQAQVWVRARTVVVQAQPLAEEGEEL